MTFLTRRSWSYKFLHQKPWLLWRCPPRPWIIMRSHVSSPYRKADWVTSCIRLPPHNRQSTMDFSMMPVDDGVVDSPQNGGKCLHPVSSPSPLKGRPLIISPHDSPAMNVGTQRKLYDEKISVVHAHKATDTLAETNAIRANSSRQTIPSSCNYQERPTTSNGLWRILPRRTSLGVGRHQCKSHDKNPIRVHSGRCLWDVWEEKSLKEQRQ